MSQTLSASEGPLARSPLPFSRRTLGAVGIAVAIAAAGAFWIWSPKSAESTDAAYVQADSSIIAPKVRGLVAKVLTAHNQPVRKGDPLVQIDPEEFQARVTAADAEVKAAQAGVQSAQAALQAQDADERLALSNIRAAATAIRSTDAQNMRAQTDDARFEHLADSGAVARREVDAYHAAAVTARSEADHSLALLAVSRDSAEAVRAKRAVLIAALAQTQAALQRAQAGLSLAQQDLSHTLIQSPMDGVVGDRQVEAGDYVQPGTRLMSVTPLRALYLTANFKETQVNRMTPGQRVRIKVDALPGHVLTGRIDTLAPGTGSQYSLLPFEPGAGNFTKIVQRVPVRIAFDEDQPLLSHLRPGLSAEATVELENAKRP